MTEVPPESPSPADGLDDPLRDFVEALARDGQPDDWQPYDAFGDPVSADITNSGDMCDFGGELARWQIARSARALLARSGAALEAPPEPTLRASVEALLDEVLKYGPRQPLCDTNILYYARQVRESLDGVRGEAPPEEKP